MKKILVVLVIALVAFLLFWRNTPPTTQTKSLSNLIRVGVNAEYPPFVFIQDGKIVGFDIDVINTLATHIGATIEIKDMPWSSLIPQLQSGGIDIQMGVKPTPERAERVFFTKPYFEGDQLIIITRKDDSAPETVNDLVGKQVVVNEGFVSDIYMSEIPGVMLQRLSTVAEGFMALSTKRADAFVSAQSSVQEYFRQHGTEHVTITLIPDTEDQNAIAISKQRPDLRDKLASAITAAIQNGTLQQLEKKWNLK